KKQRPRWLWWLIGLTALTSIVVVIAVTVVIIQKKKTTGKNYPISKYANLKRLEVRKDGALPDRERVFIMGDIHGCLDEFNQLIEEIQFNPSNDLLILAGDLVAKGPDSIGVVRRARELGAWCVRGNHDDKVIRFKTYELQTGSAADPEDDTTDGMLPEGDDVIDHLKLSNYHARIASNISKEDYDYLSSCPAIMYLPQWNNSVIVHAGLDPGITDLTQQEPFYSMTMRVIDDDGEPTKKKKAGTTWSTLWNEEQEDNAGEKMTVYYGHSAKEGLLMQSYSIGLDSGCVYGRSLSVVELKSRQVTSIPCETY
ncbi:Metallo-dependent phosphatase, partial [Hesseltinella vesiculosa]